MQQKQQEQSPKLTTKPTKPPRNGPQVAIETIFKHQNPSIQHVLEIHLTLTQIVSVEIIICEARTVDTVESTKRGDGVIAIDRAGVSQVEEGG